MIVTQGYDSSQRIATSGFGGIPFGAPPTPPTVILAVLPPKRKRRPRIAAMLSLEESALALITVLRLRRKRNA